MQPIDALPMPEKPVISKDYRVVFANAFGLRFSDNDATVYFMMSDDPEKLEEAERQVGVVMTPRSIKTLGIMLLEIVARVEEASGDIIPVRTDEQKAVFDAFRNALTVNQEKS